MRVVVISGVTDEKVKVAEDVAEPVRIGHDDGDGDDGKKPVTFEYEILPSEFTKNVTAKDTFTSASLSAGGYTT